MRIIGVSGGSGSGKTTLARVLNQELGQGQSTLLLQDSYYIDRSHQFTGDGSINFDHPEGIDWPLMAEHLRALRRGQPVQVPVYDFATHKRKSEVIQLEPRPYVIVDGILIFVLQEMQELFDLRIFVDTTEPIRFARRLKRDVEERGRTPDGVRRQYEATVRPMHDQFVEPTKTCAHMVVSGEESFDQVIADVLAKL